MGFILPLYVLDAMFQVAYFAPIVHFQAVVYLAVDLFFLFPEAATQASSTGTQFTVRPTLHKLTTICWLAFLVA